MPLTRAQAVTLRELVLKQKGYVAWLLTNHNQREMAPFVAAPVTHQDRTYEALVGGGYVERERIGSRNYRPTEKGRAVA